MSTVTLTIGPITYSVACADGEEAHIAALGAMIAEKYAQLGSARAPLEAQNLVFAGLFLADELAESRKRADAAAQDSAALAETAAELARLRADNDRLASELARAKDQANDQANDQASTAPQPEDGAPGPALTDTEFAEKLEALAARAEAAAAALEADPASA